HALLRDLHVDAPDGRDHDRAALETDGHLGTTLAGLTRGGSCLNRAPPAGAAKGHRMGLHDQWYTNAIIYCLDVETFADSNGDGIGDFPGLTRRLDYLYGLGITCLWLMPFYPSPG